MLFHLRFEDPDLLVESDDHSDQGPDGGGVGGGQRGGLAEVLAAQRGQDRVGLARDVTAAGPLERGGDLGAGQPRRPGRVRGLAQQFQRVAGVEVIERLQRGGEVLPQLVPQPLHRAGPVPDHRLVRPGHHLDALGLRGCPRPPGAAGGNRCAPCPPACARRRRRSWRRTPPCRSRYREASSGFTGNTVYPAAIRAATHGPRSVSIPITTSASSASSGTCRPMSPCSCAHPGRALGQPLLRQDLPGLVHHLDVVMVG